MVEYNGQAKKKNLVIITIFPPDAHVSLEQMHHLSIVRKLAHLLYDGPLDHEEKSRDDSLCNFVRDTEIFILSYVKGIKLCV